jgi:Flp pilus assembly protein TadB
MSLLPLLGALAGVLAAAGLLLVATAARRTPPRPPRPPGRLAGMLLRTAGVSGTLRERRARRARLAGALAAGGVVYVVSDIPILALMAGYAVLGAPLLLQTRRTAAERIAVRSALSQWVRALNVRFQAGATLNAALRSSAAHDLPEPIAEGVRLLADRLTQGMDTVDAIALWKAEYAQDSTAEFIAIALHTAAARPGGELTEMFRRLSATVDQQTRAALKVDAQRASIRTTVRLINIIILTVFIALQVDRTFMQPYTRPLGQLVLAALAAGYTVALVAMDRIARGAPEPAITGPAAEAQPTFEVFGRTA